MKYKEDVWTLSDMIARKPTTTGRSFHYADLHNLQCTY